MSDQSGRSGSLKPEAAVYISERLLDAARADAGFGNRSGHVYLVQGELSYPMAAGRRGTDRESEWAWMADNFYDRAQDPQQVYEIWADGGTAMDRVEKLIAENRSVMREVLHVVSAPISHPGRFSTGSPVTVPPAPTGDPWLSDSERLSFLRSHTTFYVEFGLCAAPIEIVMTDEGWAQGRCLLGVCSWRSDTFCLGTRTLGDVQDDHDAALKAATERQ